MAVTSTSGATTTAPPGTSEPPSAPEPTSLAITAERDARRRRRLVRVARLLSLGVFIGVWSLVSGPVVAEFYVGDPEKVGRILWDWITSGFIWTHIGYTLLTATVGFFVGSVAAILMGLLLGMNAHAYSVMDPFMNAFYSIPKIAFAPLLVTWFGLGLSPKILLAAVVVFFLMFNATLAGTRHVDGDLLDQVYLMGGSRRDAIVKIVLPTVAIHVLHGLRMSFPYALHGAILGELIAANTGLGYVLQFARGSYNTSAMIAALLVVMVVAVLIVQLLDRLESRLPKV